MENEMFLEFKHVPGAGILPYAIIDNKIKFLFHKTFCGKKVNFLVDFGGSYSKEEIESESDPLLIAIREFSEETGGLIDYKDSENKQKEHILKQIDGNEKLDEITLQSSEFVKNRTSEIYEYFTNNKNCLFETKNGLYRLYFLKIDYFDVENLNLIFSNYVKKRREFIWIDSDDILADKDHVKLLPRIKNCEKFYDIVKSIKNKKFQFL